MKAALLSRSFLRPKGIAPLALALISGCAAGPDFTRPAPPDVAAYTAKPLPAETASADVPGGGAQRFVEGLDLPAQWWTLFRSESLNRLIDEALRANPTLQAAQAALRQAMESVQVQRGFYYPAV